VTVTNEATAGPLPLVEEAVARLKTDAGALFEPAVIEALRELRASDMPAYVRLRAQAKRNYPGLPLRELDKALGTLTPRADASPLDGLVSLARQECELHHDSDRRAVAIVERGTHREVWPVDSAGFADYLRSAYWRAHGAGLPETTIKAALATLSAAGIHDGQQVPVHRRAAVWRDGYMIDLGDQDWRAIHVSPYGWELVSRPPVLFTRTTAMRPLPEPQREGADLGLLWRHVNVPPASRLFVLAWLLECFRPETPFPVLELVGEQGSAKSTTQSVLRSLVDPNKVMLRGAPKSEEDIYVASANNWLVSYENLSGLTARQQDVLCTLATGGGAGGRQLYTNSEEHVIETKRPVVLNGIAVVATRPDLIDRTVHVELPTIAPEHRRDDAQSRAAWKQDRPKVFAALLNLFAKTLTQLPRVQLERKQRMADYERLGEAMARALHCEPGRFQREYAELVRRGTDRALDGHPVALALDKLIERLAPPVTWEGTAGRLYIELERFSPADRKGWPHSPKGLADELRRLAPAYRARGLDIARLGHSREGALWRIAAAQPR